MKTVFSRVVEPKQNCFIRMLFLVFLCMFISSISLLTMAQAAVWYIKTDGTDPVDCSGGQSWGTAFQTIEKGIECASPGDEIWVKMGTYVPGLYLHVDKDISIFGGFDGEESIREERDWENNETIVDQENSGRCFYIVSSAMVDGFTISNGQYFAGAGVYIEYTSSNVFVNNCRFFNNNAPSGGGIFNASSDLTVNNCNFISNSSGSSVRDGYGGGIYNHGGLTLTNCTFSGNEANFKGGGVYNGPPSSSTINACIFSQNYSEYYGGALLNEDASAVITNCKFSGNSSDNSGGGITNWGSSPIIADCTFYENTTKYYGGGIDNENSSPYIVNCIFVKNAAGIVGGGIQNIATNSSFATISNCLFSENNGGSGGGGIANVFASSPDIITNCTFSGNFASKGGGIFNNKTSPEIRNCILWGDSAPEGPEIYDYESAVSSIKYSNIDQDGYAGSNGNIRQLPLFSDSSTSDYRLQAGSPCIDAGDNLLVPSDTADLDGDSNTTEPIPIDLDRYLRFVDDPLITDTGNGSPPIVDMGAYEFADYDRDGVPDEEEWGPNGDDQAYDGNNDLIPDSQQGNTASMHTYDDQNYVTLASPEGTVLSEVQAIAPPGTPPGGVDFEYGCFDFSVTGVGSGVSTSVTFFGPDGAVFDTYYKYGPTEGDSTDHWYEFLFDVPSQTGAQFDGNEITLHFVDGQRGDDDLSPNGTIIEPGGPAIVLAPECEGDFESDGDVNGSDLAVFAADFGRMDCGVPTTCPGDFDKDGDVDGSDLAVFAADFGRTDCLP